MRPSPAVTLFLALVSTACEAPRSSGPASGAAPTAATADSALVCRTERPTGSNIPKRVCYRQEELDQASLEAQDSFRRTLSQPLPPRQ